MLFKSQERTIHFGLLLMRLGIGSVLLYQAVPKMVKGSARWAAVGADFRFLYAQLPVEAVGLAVLLIMVLGGLCMLSGYFFRLASFFLALLSGLYFMRFMKSGYITLPLYAAQMAFVFAGFIYCGPGRYAVAVKLEKKGG